MKRSVVIILIKQQTFIPNISNNNDKLSIHTKPSLCGSEIY